MDNPGGLKSLLQVTGPCLYVEAVCVQRTPVRRGVGRMLPFGLPSSGPRLATAPERLRRMLDRTVGDGPSLQPSRKLPSIVNRFENSFTISAAGVSVRLVTRCQASFIPFALRHTTAPSSRPTLVTFAPRRSRERPLLGVHAIADLVTPVGALTLMVPGRGHRGECPCPRARADKTSKLRATSDSGSSGTSRYWFSRAFSD